MKCMKCRDTDAQLVVEEQLKGMAYNARYRPGMPNPINSWGNSQWCRFIDGNVMIYNYDEKTSLTFTDAGGELSRWGALSVLNYGMLNRLFPQGSSILLSCSELKEIYGRSNNIAFNSSHFFVLENKREADALNAAKAVEEWLSAVVSAVLELTEEEKKEVFAFREAYLRLPAGSLSPSSTTTVATPIKPDAMKASANNSPHCEKSLSSVNKHTVSLLNDDSPSGSDHFDLTGDDEPQLDPVSGRPMCSDMSFSEEDLLDCVRY